MSINMTGRIIVRTAKYICFLVTFGFIFMTTYNAQAATVSYTLDDVLLADGEQITGAFDWTFDICDFEGGNGVFTALEIPWRPPSSVPPLDQEGMVFTIEDKQIEISLDGNLHDYGLDISIKFLLSSPLSPTQPSLIDSDESFYECCGNGFKDLEISSGSISPIISPFLDMDRDGIRNGLDPSPDCINNNACNAVDNNTAVTLSDQVIVGMLLQCADHDGVNVGINIGSNVHVMNNGELQVITPVTTFTPGFKVDPGGKLTVFSEALP